MDTQQNESLAKFNLKLPVDWSSFHKLSVGDCLEAARVICLSEEEAAWDVSDFSSALNPRNEAAALALLVAHRQDVTSGNHQRDCTLDSLCNSYIERSTQCQTASTHASASSTSLLPTHHPYASDSAEYKLLRWGREQGVESRLSPACFSGGLRGMPADEGIAAGEVAVSVPSQLLITASTAAASDLGRAVSRIPGLDADSVTLIWTMADRHDPESPHAPFWKCLPSAFDTGLSASESDVQMLRGTPLYEEAQHARKHVREAFTAMQPVLKALSTAYPQHLKEEYFTLEAYLWAVELWYAYAIQVQFPDGEIKAALVPVVSLINHSPYPHIVHFSKIDPDSGRLRLTTFRSVSPGEQCFLSYGPLPSSHLLLFYGFAPTPNPFDALQLHFEVAKDKHQGMRTKALRVHRLPLHHQIATFPTRLSPHLLPCLRVLAASPELLKSLASSKALPTEPLGGTNEAAALELLRQKLQQLHDAFQQQQQQVPATKTAASKSASRTSGSKSAKGRRRVESKAGPAATQITEGDADGTSHSTSEDVNASSVAGTSIHSATTQQKVRQQQQPQQQGANNPPAEGGGDVSHEQGFRLQAHGYLKSYMCAISEALSWCQALLDGEGTSACT